MATREGLTLAKAFMQINSVQFRRRIVDLVKQIEECTGVSFCMSPTLLAIADEVIE